MCIGFIKICSSDDDKYRLIILNNRDEVIDRPTAHLAWNDGILSGIDELDEAHGTWLGINTYGDVGMVLSITQPSHQKMPKAPSRGDIVKKYLKSENKDDFFENLRQTASNYNGFQFIGMERLKNGKYTVKSLTNILVEKVEQLTWNPGSYVFSNSPPTNPLQKVIYGTSLFEKSMECSNEMSITDIHNSLLKIATDRTRCLPDKQLELQTGHGEDYYGHLSSIFVRFPEKIRYGTRSHSIIVVDSDNNVNVFERALVPNEKVDMSTWHDSQYEFKIKDRIKS